MLSRKHLSTSIKYRRFRKNIIVYYALRGRNWTFHVECDVSSMNRRRVPCHTRLNLCKNCKSYDKKSQECPFLYLLLQSQNLGPMYLLKVFRSFWVYGARPKFFGTKLIFPIADSECMENFTFEYVFTKFKMGVLCAPARSWLYF